MNNIVINWLAKPTLKESKMNKKQCTDYDGMGNQGRFPKTKEVKNKNFDSVKTFLIVTVVFLSLVFLGITLNY